MGLCVWRLFTVFLWCTDSCVCLAASEICPVSSKQTRKSAVWDHTRLFLAVVYLFCFQLLFIYLQDVILILFPCQSLNLKAQCLSQHPLVVSKHTEIGTPSCNVKNKITAP